MLIDIADAAESLGGVEFEVEFTEEVDEDNENEEDEEDDEDEEDEPAEARPTRTIRRMVSSRNLGRSICANNCSFARRTRRIAR